MKYFNGKEEIEIEVNAEVEVAMAELDRREALSERRETRRHVSLNKTIEGCNHDYTEVIVDKQVDIIGDYLGREEVDELRAAIKTLEPQQQELVRKIFYEGRSIKDVAVEYGVSSPAIADRLKKIYARLRKKTLIWGLISAFPVAND